MKPQKLYSTTIIIWSEKMPPSPLEDDTGELGFDEVTGLTFCSDIIVTEVTDQSKFPDTTYFDSPNLLRNLDS